MNTLCRQRTLGNLPNQQTTFVGREQALVDIARLVAAHQLVSLTGAGGTGKTRLALQAGEDLLDRFEHGVWFIELSPVVEPERVAAAVARALGLPYDPARPFNAVVQDHCRERALLLILDNCEHLVQACAEVVADWLPTCPGLKILATSRQALGIAGEITFYVPSLTVPDPAHLPPVQALGCYEAVRLFTDRAAAAKRDFALHNSNAYAVAQICRRLDGIPLAIELAAARVRAMQAKEIAAQLDDCFAQVTGGARTVLPRHQTLRTVVGWTHALLDTQQRAVLRRLAEFAGGCTLAEAEATCGDAPLARQDVLDTLTRLADQSLVVIDLESDETRYRILEPVRQYALRED